MANMLPSKVIAETFCLLPISVGHNEVGTVPSLAFRFIADLGSFFSCFILRCLAVVADRWIFLRR